MRCAYPRSQAARTFLLFAVNNASFVEESDYGNNLIVYAYHLSVRPPDLATIAGLSRRALTGTLGRL